MLTSTPSFYEPSYKVYDQTVYGIKLEQIGYIYSPETEVNDHRMFCSNTTIEKGTHITKLKIESEDRINRMEFEFSDGTKSSHSKGRGSIQTEFSFEGKYLLGIDGRRKSGS